jgi:hopene-associated glycosyltransferase HpnB
MLPLLLAGLALLSWIVLAGFRAGFWRVRPAPACSDPPTWPPVVAIVPARDEAGVIGASLESLLRQDYPGAYRVVVVDDHSLDATADIARSTARALEMQGRLELVAARDLPAGWAGKVWAQAEGLTAATRELAPARYLFLTDADIVHDPHTLRRLVACAEARKLVLASLMVRLRCESLAEKALVPAFVFFFAMLYPFARVNDKRSRIAAAAGGCMLARADAIEAIGGLAAIKGALIDDCALAAALKAHGPIRLDLAQQSRSLRGYEDWAGLWNVIGRSAYTQLKYSPWRLAGTVAGMLWLFLAPPVLAVAAGSAVALLAWLLMAAIYVPILRYYGRSPLWAPALPIVALFYVGATLASAWRYWRGRGGQWKGRVQAPLTPAKVVPAQGSAPPRGTHAEVAAQGRHRFPPARE